MVDIPLYPENHHKKQKKAQKKKDTVSAQQSKNKSTQKQPKPPSINDEMKKAYIDARNKMLRGDIKLPTAFDKFISENLKSSDELVLSQTAWLAKTSAYIAMHLKRWAEERVMGGIENWYITTTNPFTERLKEINGSCENLGTLTKPNNFTVV